jgi:hypothetical protein
VFWERLPATVPAHPRLPAAETARLGLFDRLLGWGAMAPLALGATAAWLTAGDVRSVAMSLEIIWAGAVLAFLAGVGRGASLGMSGVARRTRIAIMLWTFGLAIGSMLALRPLTSLTLLIAGFVSLGLEAWFSSARGEPSRATDFVGIGQVVVGAVSLCAVAARLMTVR